MFAFGRVSASHSDDTNNQEQQQQRLFRRRIRDSESDEEKVSAGKSTGKPNERTDSGGARVGGDDKPVNE